MGVVTGCHQNWALHDHAGYKVRDNSEGVTARKVVQMYQLPRILVLHLKRFSYGLSGTGKIHKIVHYGERLWSAPVLSLF